MTQGQRDAVILLSGLHREDIGGSVDLAAARFVAALEAEAGTVAATFRLEDARDEDYGAQADGFKTRIVTVSRQNPGDPSPQPLFDIYGLDYRKTLVGDMENKRPISHLLSTFWILASNAPKLLFSVKRRSKKSAEKWQVRLGWLLYLILFVYFLTIVGAALGTLAGLATSDSPAAGAGAPATAEQAARQPPSDAEEIVSTLTGRTASFLAPATEVMQLVVVWVTAIGLFLKVDLKSWIQKSGLGITAASHYLTLDRRRRAIEEQFAALLNHIGQNPGVQSRRVHVVSYSFGSIIALDALFPYDRAAHVFGQIDTLVTVGCPFDFVRTYWPTYFQSRTQLSGVPRMWINIYAAADVLGSDFLDQPPEQGWTFRRRIASAAPSPSPIPCGIDLDGGTTLKRPDVNERYGRSTTLDQYSAMEKLGFLGFAIHRQYWEGTGPGCYRNIVRAMFQDDPALG